MTHRKFDPDEVTELVTREAYVGNNDDQYLSFVLDPDGGVGIKVVDDGEHRLRWTGEFSDLAFRSLVRWYSRNRQHHEDDLQAAIRFLMALGEQALGSPNDTLESVLPELRMILRRLGATLADLDTSDAAALVRDLRHASNTIGTATDLGIEEGIVRDDECEGDYELVTRLREHARRLESSAEPRRVEASVTECADCKLLESILSQLPADLNVGIQIDAGKFSIWVVGDDDMVRFGADGATVGEAIRILAPLVQTEDLRSELIERKTEDSEAT